MYAQISLFSYHLLKNKLFLGSQFTAFLDSEGRVVESKALRERVFYGGIEHHLRKEVKFSISDESRI